jgi:hypothetical protein
MIRTITLLISGSLAGLILAATASGPTPQQTAGETSHPCVGCW